MIGSPWPVYQGRIAPGKPFGDIVVRGESAYTSYVMLRTPIVHIYSKSKQCLLILVCDHFMNQSNVFYAHMFMLNFVLIYSFSWLLQFLTKNCKIHVTVAINSTS